MAAMAAGCCAIAPKAPEWFAIAWAAAAWLATALACVAWALMPAQIYGYRGPLSTSGIESLRDGAFRSERAAYRIFLATLRARNLDLVEAGEARLHRTQRFLY